VTASEESSGIQVADLILKDVSLTAHIIRIANSVTFNPSNISVTTVSRAIINIGFTNIRSICLSIKVLEAVLKDSPAPVLVAMLAKSLHGASQSKALCSKMTATQQEEVFVASLISRLAELLVLGAREPEVKQMSNDIEASSTDVEKNRVAEKYLGVSLARLTKTLTKQWRIEGLVNDLLVKSDEPCQRVQAVLLGDEISRASLLGWDSNEFKEVALRVAEFKGIGETEAIRELMDVADETAKTISAYGKKILVDQIPTSTKQVKPIERLMPVDKECLQANADIQLEKFQQLSEVMLTEFNINKVFKIILQGLHQGVGLERVTLAIFDKSHQKVVAKYASGKGTESWREKFIVKYERSHSGFLYNLFEKDQVVWVGGEGFSQISQSVTSEYYGITKQKNFFIAPLKAGDKRIGFIYADLGESSRDLNKTYFEGFGRFIQQAKLALTILANRQS
jgi:HD-like signal output (HDOD) protein